MKVRIIKKVSVIAIVLWISLLVCGCTNEEDKFTTDVTGTNTVKQSIVEEKFDESGTGILSCSMEAEAGDGIDVDLNYTVKYNNGNILELVSIQKVSSDNQESLDLYENAYESIADNYDGLKYYVNSIVRDSNSVTYTITINYDKIDIKKLLAIEGEEDNIIKNGNAKLSLWLDLAGKMGTVCEEI